MRFERASERNGMEWDRMHYACWIFYGCEMIELRRNGLSYNTSCVYNSLHVPYNSN
jgi:hypothetical protein